jgi:hypothetical protein
LAAPDRSCPLVNAGFRLGSNSAVWPTNSEGLLLLGWAAKSCLAASGRLLPLRAHGGHLLGALDFLKEDNAHPALKSIREVSRSFEFGFDT